MGDIANLVKNIPFEERVKIALQIKTDYDQDIDDRSEWEEKRAKWYKLWACKRDKKDHPWPNASNVCVPLLATACNQFQARAYQSIFAAPGMVKALPVGDNDKKSAKKIEKFLNWQTQYDMEEYEEVFDETLLSVPINGVAFKKFDWDSEGEKPRSNFVSAIDIVLPYKTKRLRDGSKQAARRVVHRIWEHFDVIEDKIDTGVYHWEEEELPSAAAVKEDDSELAQTVEMMAGVYTSRQEEKPHLILECHKRLKLEGDEKKKPYIFTVDYDTGALLRVTSREYNGHELCHFIDYHFIPNPEGFYSFGFGHFLEDLNEMSNAAFNQIFDSGTLANLPFFFYERRTGIKQRQIKLFPGAAIEVKDHKGVHFPNMQRVDQVLFQVLGVVQQYTEMFTSTSEYLTGREAKGTKTPTAHGTLAIIEQGLVTFAVLTKRIFRSLRKELKLISELNQIFLDDEKEYLVMDGEDNIAFPKIKKDDFNGHYRVIPIGDPSYASKGTRRQEAIEIYNVLSGATGAPPNPLIWGMPGNPDTGEGGIPPNINAIHELTSDILETYGRPNKSIVLPPLPEPPVLPEEENAMFAQGDYEKPKRGEDHQSHLAIHTAFKNTLYYRTMKEEYKPLLDKHIEETIKLSYLENVRQGQLGGQNVVQ